jgi:hypothetical protein
MHKSPPRLVAPRLLRFFDMRPPTIITTLILSVACASCAAHVYTAPPAEPVYLTSETVPVDIETYPSTVYEGRNVYLYSGHWYYRDRDRWQYYRNEPEQLRRHRQFIQQAPPAYPERYDHREHH